jgi:two-component system, sensor histidine kinase and response regulator
MSEEHKLASKNAELDEFMDLPDLLARVENDHELLTELFLMFREELPRLKDALHDAMDLGDLSQAAKAAHTLKGMLANMSAKQGTMMAATLEAAARSGNIPAIKETLVSLDSEITAFSAALDMFIAGK